MKLLAFDTSTDHMSVAVAQGQAPGLRVWQFEGAGGAQASSTLISTVQDLLAQAQLTLSALDAICFGCGPGSFTGLRTACAVAQGLAFGAGVPVLPVHSLLAVAESARMTALGDAPTCRITALLDARMDEIYAASFAFDAGVWTTLDPAELIKPQQVQALSQRAPQAWLAGNVFDEYRDAMALAPDVPRISALPTAVAMLRLAPQLLQQGQAVPPALALPTYVRDKVAQTSAERAAIKTAQAAAR